MGKILYVGNLSYSVTHTDLESWFTPFGMVQTAQVIQDREMGRSKGFGFVEMDTDAQAEAAIQGLNDHEQEGARTSGVTDLIAVVLATEPCGYNVAIRSNL